MTDDATPIAPAHSTAWMSTHEALRLAKVWTDGQPLDDLPQWRTAIKVLADEIATLRASAEAAEKDAAKLREDIGPLLADMTALEAENEQLRQDAERWAPVAGYESMYEVSTVGRIRSLSRVDSDGNRRKGAALVPYKKATGYLQVALSRGGERSEQYVHRLVAKAFLDNPDSKPQVNHIDGDPANNEVRNLEWATNAENQTHCRRILAKGVTAVIGTCIKTGAQVRFGTLAEAGEAGFTRANIQKCLSGRRSHAGGYRWSAVDAAIDAAIAAAPITAA